jgi:Na+-transporting NADH:ubiquinone oxidoreductase subunit A
LAAHRLKRGLDLPLAGEPEQVVYPARDVSRVALLGEDSPGMKPSLRVAPGDHVRCGQALFEDKKWPAIRYTAPATGTVAAIHRGDRRDFRSLVIDVDPQEGAAPQLPFSSHCAKSAAAWSAGEVRALLLESGLWTALRTRPFSQVPAPDSEPYALFITATDTRPHSPAQDVVLADRFADFGTGVLCLAKLCAGDTHVCVAPGSSIPVPQAVRVKTQVFDGPHPCGNAGTHIHVLCPVDLERTVWHIGYQDVAAVGRLVSTGRLDVSRVVALAGPSVLRPRLLRTRLGASIDELVKDETAPGTQRVVSGSVLDGRTAQGDALGYLGRYHQQVSVLAEATERELFGWIRPGFDKFSVWGVVAGAFTGRPQALNTTTNGGARPMGTILLRALLMNNDERAEALGALELDEEDLALCTFVCPGKAEYGPLLRAALTRIQKEAA